MLLAAQIMTGVVAVLHVGFFVLESILWTTPGVRKRFAMSEADAQATKLLAVNQGLYNLGLAVGLVVALATGDAMLQTFLLAYIAAMGVVGAVTAKGSILVIQTLPALIALVLYRL